MTPATEVEPRIDRSAPAPALEPAPEAAETVQESAGGKRTLFLDDDPSRAQSFLAGCPGAVWVETVEQCLDRLGHVWDEVHLDHDLGGKKFVDPNRVDCGMEVIRWLCKEPRPHLRETFFYIHTHNTLVGLLMVLQMRESGYRAEFRPFGFEFNWFAGGDAGEILDGPPAAHEFKPKPQSWLKRTRIRFRRFLLRFQAPRV